MNNNTLIIITTISLLIGLPIGWFITEIFIKKEKTYFFDKFHWMIFVILPFLIFVIIAIPLFATKQNYLTILLGAGVPFVFLLGSSTSVFLYKYRQKRKVKEEQLKDLIEFGHKSNRENLIKKNDKNKFGD